MGSGKRIILLATLVVLGVQSLNCVLEIGFIYNGHGSIVGTKEV